MNKNVFIVIDGMDGVGKGEVVTRLHNFLFSHNKKIRILTTREPTFGVYGKEARELLAKENDPQSNAQLCLELYVQDRKSHLKKVILPLLEDVDGDSINIVISDRYYYSTMAFQHTQGIPVEDIIELNKNFRKPDIAFILDVDAQTALSRIKNSRNHLEKFEDIDFMRKLRKNFLDLVSLLDDNILVVDASLPITDVFECVKAKVEKLL